MMHVRRLMLLGNLIGTKALPRSHIHTPPPAGRTISSPLGSIDILNQYDTVLRRTFTPRLGTGLLTFKGMFECQRGFRETALVYCVLISADILPVYEWLFCYLWVESRKKFDHELHAGKVCILGSHDPLWVCLGHMIHGGCV